MSGPVIFVSESAQMKAEVAKQNKSSQLQQSNLKPTATLEQVVHKMPYGADGMQLTQEVYNPFTTILPNAEAEESMNYLKDEEKKKKKKKKKAVNKKRNFWEWLLDLNEGEAPPPEQ